MIIYYILITTPALQSIPNIRLPIRFPSNGKCNKVPIGCPSIGQNIIHTLGSLSKRKHDKTPTRESFHWTKLNKAS